MNFVEKRRLKLAHKCVYYGKYEYALLIINKLLNDNPDDAELLKEVSILFLNMGNNNMALKYIQQSFDKEKSVETLKTLANVNMQCKNFEDAAIQYEELTKHESGIEPYMNCINAYEKLDIYTEAIRIAKAAIDKFDNAEIISTLFFIYVVCGMDKEAKECCDKLKEKYPNHPITYNALGFMHEAVYNDYPTAKKFFLKAAKLGFLESYYNLGVCCKQSEDFVNAEKYLKKLIALKSDSSMDYNYTLGSVYMAQRKLGLGYKYYKNRKSASNLKYRNRKHLWDGKDYPQQTLYISSEQGFGDNIQFIRYIPFAAKKFKNVVYSVDYSLYELFKNGFFKNCPNVTVVPSGQPIRYNKFALIMDLPNIMHMNFHNIPAAESYITCDSEKQELLRKDFFDNKNLKIGLCWRAKGMGVRDAVYRTIDAPYYFKPIMEIPDIKYYSFEMNDIFGMCKKYPQITDVTPVISSFDDTAALLKNLDILITVDTAIAHLAGALGVKTYLLLCHAPDWRWFENTSKTEWYPSVHIIKQHDRRTWEDVSESLYKAIQKDSKEYTKHVK